MAILDMGTADGSAIGNPSTGNYFIFLDSENSDRLTTRDEFGVDTVYTAGVIPTQLNDLTDVNITSLTDGQILKYKSGGLAFVNEELPVYGTELNYFTEPNLVSTTGTVTADVLNVNTTTLPIGTYELTISAQTSNDSTNSDGIVQLTFDGSPITVTTGNNEIYRVEPKESGGNNPAGAGTSQKSPVAFSYPVIVTSIGSKNIALSIKSESGVVETNMWNTYIKLIRIL